MVLCKLYYFFLLLNSFITSQTILRKNEHSKLSQLKIMKHDKMPPPHVQLALHWETESQPLGADYQDLSGSCLLSFKEQTNQNKNPYTF